ncbi:hypothetical protein DRW41_17675 [Neobacillus piezotolerans]|uniref:NAD(P)-binding domain-containing protein n=1 Tax=Neobacillus piezotolerans TaxID=2259171 RepID=A0A3D8GM60_9BACI|nr:hypothetical protein [Neobacillus piezotolerans]RDU35565.1 hypothetical protein DRW41_17675 [Neobacillus piezotolerans]
MEGALIIGVFERLGFHLCKKLLEMGYEVRGISLNPSPDGSEEDMELEIGRNSNFEKLPIESARALCGRDQALIFSLYDLYTERKITRPHSERLAGDLEELIRLNDKWDSVVLLIPDSLGRQHPEECEINPIEKAVELAEGSAERVLRVILPSNGNTRPVEEQSAKKNICQNAGQTPSESCEGSDWREAAERIALLIDQGETGTRILEGIYK